MSLADTLWGSVQTLRSSRTSLGFTIPSSLAALPGADTMSACFYRCHHPENSRLGECCDARIVIAERLAQHFSCMRAQQRGSYGVDCRGQAEMNRRLDIGDGARGRVRNLAEAMALAYLR